MTHEELDQFANYFYLNLKNYIISPALIGKNFSQVTINTLLQTCGNVILITKNNYLLQKYGNLFFSRDYVDSKWVNAATTNELFFGDNGLVNIVNQWNNNKNQPQLRILQAVLTPPRNWKIISWVGKSLIDTANQETNPLLLNLLLNYWQDANLNIIMTDSVDSALIMQNFVIPKLK